MDSPELRVTRGGRRALTVQQLAAETGLSIAAVYKLINRAGLDGELVGKVYDRAEALAAIRNRPGTGRPGQPRPRKEPAMIAEKVTENCYLAPGQPGTRTFWIAYEEHISNYGHQADRIYHAKGQGKTRKAALEDAEKSA